MKGKVYKSCLRSAILYGSETWCLREKGMSILRRTQKAMVQAMGGVTCKTNYNRRLKKTQRVVEHIEYEEFFG